MTDSNNLFSTQPEADTPDEKSLSRFQKEQIKDEKPSSPPSILVGLTGFPLAVIAAGLLGMAFIAFITD